MKATFRNSFNIIHMVTYACLILLTTSCAPQGIQFAIMHTETQPAPSSTWSVHLLPTPSTSSSPSLELHKSKTPQPSSSKSSSISSSTLSQVLDPDIFISFSPGYYLIYLFQDEIHAVSLDGSFDGVIGKAGEIRFIRYGKVATYDEKCDCTIYYELVDGKLKEYGRIRAPDLAGCRTGIAPNLTWYGSICQDSSQLIIGDVEKKWSKVIDGKTVGAERILYLPGMVWSPDNTWLAYFRVKSMDPPTGVGDLVLINILCRDSRQDCSFEMFGPYTNQKQVFNGQGASTWSYDSKMLAFASSAGAPINIFNTVTKSFTTIVSNQGYQITQLEWLPDGETLAFSQDFQIFTVSIKEGNPVLIVDKTVGPENSVSLLGSISTYPRPSFEVGNTLFVSQAGDHLNLRNSPSITSEILQQLSTGDQIQIIDGSVSSDNFTWWKVRVLNSKQEGWVVENTEWYLPSKQ